MVCPGDGPAHQVFGWGLCGTRDTEVVDQRRLKLEVWHCDCGLSRYQC